MGLLATAAAAMIDAERRTEIAARNIANAQTPGYKGEIAFSEMAAASGGSGPDHSGSITKSSLRRTSGALVDAAGPLDIAIRGDAYLLVRSGDRFFLSRGGQLRRDAEGVLVDGAGRAVQKAGGGDVVLDTDRPEILADGTVLSSGSPIASIAMVSPDDTQIAAARTGLAADQILALGDSMDSELRQNMLERSNVILSDEMVTLMRNQRLAEGGAQLVRAYDQLLGQAVTTFGKRG